MMTLAKRILVIFILLFPISKSFGEATLTHVQTVIFDDESNAKSQNRQIAGIEFNKDGTKIFIRPLSLKTLKIETMVIGLTNLI